MQDHEQGNHLIDKRYYPRLGESSLAATLVLDTHFYRNVDRICSLVSFGLELSLHGRSHVTHRL